MRNNKAFTLIELLAVIVVLSIILVIAVPRVLNVIEEADKEAFRITGEQLIKGAKDRLIYDMGETVEGKIYTIVDGAFVGDSIPMTGKLPDNGTINVTREGLTSIAVYNDTWCAKKYEDEDTIYVSKDPDCQIYTPEPVADACFSRSTTGGYVTITGYDNACSNNPIIPSYIGGLPVRVIGAASYRFDHLTSVRIPDGVTSIGNDAFYECNLKRVKLPNSVTSLGLWVFAVIQIVSFVLSEGLTQI